METFSALPVPSELSAQRPVTRSFDIFFDLRLNRQLLGYKTCLDTKRFSIKTSFASSIEATKPDLSQNGSIQNLFSIKY